MWHVHGRGSCFRPKGGEGTCPSEKSGQKRRRVAPLWMNPPSQISTRPSVPVPYPAWCGPAQPDSSPRMHRLRKRRRVTGFWFRHGTKSHRPRLPVEGKRQRDDAVREQGLFLVGNLEYYSRPLHHGAFGPTVEIDPLAHLHSPGAIRDRSRSRQALTRS